MWQKRLDSDAERCCGGDRRHSGGFLLRIMPPSWHPVPACTPRLCCRRAILRCRDDCGRRNHSTLPQRRLDSDAERCCGGDRRHSGGFLLRIMPPSWHPVPACAPRLRCRRAILRCRYDCCKRNHSPSRKRRIESDADLVAATTTAGGTILLRESEE